MVVEPPAAPGGPPSTRPFWVGVAVGLPLMALGVRGALADAVDTHPAELARWVVGSALVHDALVVPVVSVVALVGRRLSPRWAWPPLRWALATTAVLLVVSRPFVARYGYRAANPTALDRPYGAGIAVALGAVWAAAVAWAAVARRRPPAPGAGQAG